MATKCPFGGEVYERDLKKCPNCGKNPTIIGVIILIIIILSISIFVITIFSDSSSSNTTTPKKYTACENRSDTYHKCKWSGWENRCVCKQR